MQQAAKQGAAATLASCRQPANPPGNKTTHASPHIRLPAPTPPNTRQTTSWHGGQTAPAARPHRPAARRRRGCSRGGRPHCHHRRMPHPHRPRQARCVSVLPAHLPALLRARASIRPTRLAGGLAEVPPDQLLGTVLNGIITRSGIDATEVGDVCVGNVLQVTAPLVPPSLCSRQPGLYPRACCLLAQRYVRGWVSREPGRWDRASRRCTRGCQRPHLS
jgi:hypothetical protein